MHFHAKLIFLAKSLKRIPETSDGGIIFIIEMKKRLKK